MRILTTPPQGDLAQVTSTARAAEAACYPADLVQDIQRIPSAFTNHHTSW